MPALFRLTALVLLLSVAAGCVLSQQTAAVSPGTSSRPNILFCIADDWGWPHAGAYGDPVVKTPAFDRLAREGVLFRHAYVSSPSCTPSRNAILSGQWHWRLGSGANLWSTWDENTPVYPLLLAKAGYHVGHWRKSFGPGKLDNWKDHPAGPVYKGFDEFLADRPDKSTPFCFWLGASDPHRPYDTGSGAKSGMDLKKIRLFEHFPDSPEIRSDVADYYFEIQRFDSDIAKAIAKLEELGELDNTIIVMAGDHGMPFPRCKGNLYDSGAQVPLAIRWGKFAPAGRQSEDLVSLTDLAPTFLEAAGVERPAVMTGRSLMPILTRSRSGKIDPTRAFVLSGKERHVPGQEKPDTGGTPMRAIRTHEYLYIRNLTPERWPAGSPHWQQTTVPGAWLADCDNGPAKTYLVTHRDKDGLHRRLYDLSFGKRPLEELYDLKKDPQQLHNVADDSAYAQTKADLWKTLESQLRSTGDPRVLGGGEKFDSYPYYGGAPLHPDYNRK